MIKQIVASYTGSMNTTFYVEKGMLIYNSIDRKLYRSTGYRSGAYRMRPFLTVTGKSVVMPRDGTCYAVVMLSSLHLALVPKIKAIIEERFK